MNSIPVGKIEMDRILESAVILSWHDLLRPTQRNLIQVEYVPGTRRSYLKIWQLTGKGEWSLVCEYWTSHAAPAATDDGMIFSNGYASTGLAAMLEVIMQYSHRFAERLTPGPTSIQVKTPTEQETLAANECMMQGYESLGLAFTSIQAVAAA